MPIEPLSNGILHLIVLAGTLYRDTEFIVKMDPFVTIEYGGLTYSTRHQKGGGKNPIWNETFEIPINGASKEGIRIACNDKDMVNDDLIGETTVMVEKMCTKTLSMETYSLFY